MIEPAMGSFDLEAALARVRGRGPCVILTHDNPDPDSMAAAEALRALLEAEAGVRCTIARGGIVGRAENRAMVSVLGLSHVDVGAIQLDDFPLLALVDTQPETGNNSLPVGHRVDIIVDHHPKRPGAARAPWCDIREDFGASCTIAYSYLKEREVPISKTVATALLYAIKSETRDLGRESSPHEFEAYSELLRLADLEKLYAIAEPKVPAEHFAALDRALRAAEVRGPLVTANLGVLGYPDLVAEIADLLLPFDEAHWVLCVGQHDGAVFLSMRTDVEHAHAGSLMRAIVDGRGAAGGHGQIAGGRLHRPVASDQELAVMYADLVAKLAAALRIGESPRPLVPRE
jgi:nanoRNase/pAp phosphatase (c-di-AMP/oligoRNAs hydrolase)